MKVTCLSIQNPVSYLCAAGIKDVENRTWKTDFRGWLYIHSSGAQQYFFPDIAINTKIKKAIDAAVKPLSWYAKAEAFIQYAEAHYGVPDLFNVPKMTDHKKEYFCDCRAIIGRVKLSDIIMDSKSIFAEDGCYHWIFSDAEMFKKPLQFVNGKLRLFQHDIPESLIDSKNIIKFN